MKVRSLALVALLLSVVSAMAQQRFSSLPIGANLDGYISSIHVWFGTDGNLTDDIFQYTRRVDGSLEAFSLAKIREMASRFVPKVGQENAQPGWALDAITDGIGGLLPYYSGESKSATIATAYSHSSSVQFTLRNGKWEVPEEVFGKVKFQFGWGVGYYIPGVTDLEIRLYDKSTLVGRLSTRERTSDLKDMCELAGVILALPDVAIPNEIARAQPLRLKWEYAEITLYTPDSFVTFLVNRTEQDGKAIRWSNPPPSFFVPPSPITLRKTGNGLLELVVTGEGTVEESDSINGEWGHPYSLALLSEGPRRFRVTLTDVVKFYRLRPDVAVQKQ